MEEVQQRRGGSLLNATISRRGALVAGAWSVPVVAVAVATPMAAASGDIDPLTELEVLAIGGAEGRYPTGANYTGGPVAANSDFRRAFSIKNTGTGSFTGSLTITFTFPRAWNEGVSERSVPAFNNMTTVDLEGRGGAAVAGASAWVTSEDPNGWEENWGTNANTAVWFRMDPAAVTLTGVSLPPGGDRDLRAQRGSTASVDRCIGRIHPKPLLAHRRLRLGDQARRHRARHIRSRARP